MHGCKNEFLIIIALIKKSFAEKNISLGWSIFLTAKVKQRSIYYKTKV